MPKADNFQWFKKNSGLPTITIAPFGVVLNQGAVDSFPDDTTYIAIGYAPKAKLIAIQPVKSPENLKKYSVFNIEKRLNNGSVRINSRGFIRLLNRDLPEIDTSTSTRFTLKWDDELGGLVADITRPFSKGRKIVQKKIED